jgi:hypothetical protein
MEAHLKILKIWGLGLFVTAPPNKFGGFYRIYTGGIAAPVPSFPEFSSLSQRIEHWVALSADPSTYSGNHRPTLAGFTPSGSL